MFAPMTSKRDQAALARWRRIDKLAAVVSMLAKLVRG
jgi:hypothetical protein